MIPQQQHSLTSGVFPHEGAFLTSDVVNHSPTRTRPRFEALLNMRSCHLFKKKFLILMHCVFFQLKEEQNPQLVTLQKPSSQMWNVLTHPVLSFCNEKVQLI